jgi:hypothetical protein
MHRRSKSRITFSRDGIVLWEVVGWRATALAALVPSLILLTLWVPAYCIGALR